MTEILVEGPDSVASISAAETEVVDSSEVRVVPFEESALEKFRSFSNSDRCLCPADPKLSKLVAVDDSSFQVLLHVYVCQADDRHCVVPAPKDRFVIDFALTRRHIDVDVMTG